MERRRLHGFLGDCATHEREIRSERESLAADAIAEPCAELGHDVFGTAVGHRVQDGVRETTRDDVGVFAERQQHRRHELLARPGDGGLQRLARPRYRDHGVGALVDYERFARRDRLYVDASTRCLRPQGLLDGIDERVGRLNVDEDRDSQLLLAFLGEPGTRAHDVLDVDWKRHRSSPSMIRYPEFPDDVSTRREAYPRLSGW